MFNKANIAGLMKKAQEMEANFKKAQEELTRMEFIGEAASGKIKITMTGKHQVKQVVIDPELLAVEDKEMLEDLLTVAFNQAVQGIEKSSQDRMGNLSSQMPPGFKLPF